MREILLLFFYLPKVKNYIPDSFIFRKSHFPIFPLQKKIIAFAKYFWRIVNNRKIRVSTFRERVSRVLRNAPLRDFLGGVLRVSIVFRYFANDYSRERYKFTRNTTIGRRRFRFPIFREAVARNFPTKWDVLRLTAGQLTNARRQGLPKMPFALQKLCFASRCYFSG